MIVSKKHKALVLRLRDTSRVTSVIPHAKPFMWKGTEFVMVPHREDEVRVLRNLGMDAPAPILHHYDWTGPFTPYQHQSLTSAFLTLNKRSFCLNGMGCIEGDAELTVQRCGKTIRISLRDLFRKFHNPSPLTKKGEAWKCRSLLGARFGHNQINNVVFKGVQRTLRFTLADGKTIRATPDHHMAQTDGTWVEAGNLKVGGHLVTNGEYHVPCPTCGADRVVGKYDVKRAEQRSCRPCKHRIQSERMSGESNPAFKGTPFVDNDGYVRIWMPEHHRADNSGRVYEHIVIAEKKLGRDVLFGEHVHHKDHNKSNNHPDNIEVLTAAEHNTLHDCRLNLDGGTAGTGGKVVILPKQSEIIAIEDGGEVDVYDLMMEAPHHNFVVNGIVVHNSGKTVATAWAFDYLYKRGSTGKLLVIAPLSTLQRTWGDTFFEHFPHLKYTVLYGDKKKRLALLAEDYDVYIINHDGIKVLYDELLAAGFRHIVIDELASFRSPKADRSKALHALCKDAEYVWGLTGTPTPNAPTDAWMQCKIVNDAHIPKWIGKFKDMVMSQISQYKAIPKPDAMETVHRVMQPAIRFAREDCIDLPPTVFETREVELTPNQKRAYQEMQKEFSTGEGAQQITAVNAGVKLFKLVQIACGAAYSTDGGIAKIDAASRLSAVDEIVEQAEGKIIIFVPFTAALEMVADHLRKYTTVEVINGGVSMNERTRIFGAFQNSRTAPRVIVANPGAMSHGLTLTEANTIIWYAPITSHEIYDQANHRIIRPGQKRSQLIVMLEGTPVERKIYEGLRHKKSMQDVLLALARG